MTKTLTATLFTGTVTLLAAAQVFAAEPRSFTLHDGNNAGRTADERQRRGNNNQLGVGVEQCNTTVAKQGTQSYLVTLCMGSYTDVPLLDGSIGEPPGRIQGLCSSVPLDPMLGPDTSRQVMKYVTDEVGDRRRNFHNPKITTIMGGSAVFVEYGYAPNNTNNTETMAKVISPTCDALSAPMLVKRQNNDNCKANLNAAIVLSETANQVRMFQHVECNGNGNDDSRSVGFTITNNNGQYSLQQTFDVQTEPDVERLHPYSVPVKALGGEMMLTCGGAGNTNPPNKGARCYMVNAAAGVENNDRVVWRNYVQRRDGNLYAHDPMPTIINDAAGNPTNMVYMTWVEIDLNGREGNGSREKGRTQVKGQIYSVSAAGLTPVSLPTYEVTTLADSSHPAFCTSKFGPNGETKAIMLQGSIVGSLDGAGRASVLNYSAANRALALEDEVVFARSIDTGWLSKFYGQNPNNQGRNYLTCTGDVPNPGFGVAGGFMPEVKSFIAVPGNGRIRDAVTGQAQPKLALAMHLIPAEVPAAPPAPVASLVADSEIPGDSASAGGCSVSNSANGFGTMILIGMAFFGVTRRRRS